MELLRQQIEALVFCSEQSISLEEIAASLKISFDWDLEEVEILAAIEEIKLKYASDDFAFELLEISEGFQFLTKKEYHITVSALIQHKAKKKLSVSQMETLAIIAYRQPISKTEVEHIRGVSCDYAMQKLLEKELIEISGKSEGPGRPIIYSTSRSFMDYFGIKSVKDLPQLKDLHLVQNEIGLPAEDNYSENLPFSSTEESLRLDTPIEPEEIVNEISPLHEAEKNLFEEFQQVSEEIVAEKIDVRDYENDSFEIDMEEKKITADLIDRKSIYIENELKNLAEEENTETEDPGNLS